MIPSAEAIKTVLQYFWYYRSDKVKFHFNDTAVNIKLQY